MASSHSFSYYPSVIKYFYHVSYGSFYPCSRMVKHKGRNGSGISLFKEIERDAGQIETDHFQEFVITVILWNLSLFVS